jgi:hypothetical protein
MEELYYNLRPGNSTDSCEICPGMGRNLTGKELVVFNRGVKGQFSLRDKGWS